MLNNSIFSKLTFIGRAFLLTTIIFTPIKGYADNAALSWTVNSASGFSDIYYRSGYVKIGDANSPRASLDVVNGLYPFRVSRNSDQTHGVLIGHDQNTGNGIINAMQNLGTSVIAKPITINAPGGNVGINGYATNYPLDVNGTINTNSNIQATGNV